MLKNECKQRNKEFQKLQVACIGLSSEQKILASADIMKRHLTCVAPYHPT